MIVGVRLYQNTETLPLRQIGVSGFKYAYESPLCPLLGDSRQAPFRDEEVGGSKYEKRLPKEPIYLDAAVCPTLDKWVWTTTQDVVV